MTGMPQKGILGVIGGSGLDKGLDRIKLETIDIKTPYTMTRSDGSFHDGNVRVFKGEIKGKEIIFLHRHQLLVTEQEGRLIPQADRPYLSHGVDPTNTNYRANVWALAYAGATDFLAFSLVGGMKAEPYIKVGKFYTIDKITDKTRCRQGRSFYGRGVVVHKHTGPCQRLQKIIRTAGNSALEDEIEKRHGVVCIEGPDFRDDPEIKDAYDRGLYDLIGETQYPEQKLAEELERCWGGVFLVTDPNFGAVNDDIRGQAFKREADNPKIVRAVAMADFYDPDCGCHSALDGAVLQPIAPQFYHDKWVLDNVLRRDGEPESRFEEKRFDVLE